MRPEQKTVAIGAASGVATMLLLTWLLYTVLPDPDAATLAERLAYALKWQALPGLLLLTMIGAIGNARAMSEAIDPTAGQEDAAMKINIRVLDNSVQQFALFLAGSMALSASLSAEHITLIGAAAIVFVIARVAFWIGYRIHPLYRAAGFSSTAYLNAGLLWAAVWFGLRG
jgi:hypothetical protein